MGPSHLTHLCLFQDFRGTPSDPSAILPPSVGPAVVPEEGGGDQGIPSNPPPLHTSTSGTATSSPSPSNPSSSSSSSSLPERPGNPNPPGPVGAGIVSADSGSGSNSAIGPIPIPAHVSIPVQYQNGHVDTDLSQQMLEMDLKVQCPNPLQSRGTGGVTPAAAAVGAPLAPQRPGFMDFPPGPPGRNRGAAGSGGGGAGGTGGGGAFGGQNFSATGSPLMYSESYPHGALYLGSYSNPMVTSWQYNPNPPNQGIK